MNVLFQPSYRNTLNHVYFRSNNSTPDFVMKVDENLYRGRKPESPNEIRQLKDMGISTIIDLSTDRGRMNEAECAAQNDIGYVELPFELYPGPANEQLERFFDVTKNAKENNEKVYVHCTYGRDRTGLMVNLYKIHNNMPLDNMSHIQKMIAEHTYERFCEDTKE